MLADGIAAALPELQRHAEATMQDTLAFGSYTTGTDPESGMEVDDVFAATFTSAGKVSAASRGSIGDQVVRMVTVGGTERPVVSGGIQIPSDRTEAVTAGMLVKVTALGPKSPAHLLNRVYRIEGESTKSYQTARRFDVVEV